MKKMFGVFVLGIVLFSMMGIASAEPIESVQDFIEGAYDAVSPSVGKLIGTTPDTDIFLAKVMFLIIIFSVAWVALSKINFFSENDWVLWVVSTGVSILSIRWMGDSKIINTILLPYSVFGIVVSAGLPFILYFIIIEGFKSKTSRKVAWAFFAVVFLGLWVMRSGTGTTGYGPAIGGFAWIYLATAILSLVVLKFDGTIQKIRSKISAEKSLSYRQLERKHRVMDDLDRYRNLRVSLVDRGATAAEITRIDAHITRLERSLAAYA